MTQEQLLLKQLQGIRRRIRALFALHGLGRLLAVLPPAVLLTIFLDYLLPGHFPAPLRAVLLAGVIVLAVFIVTRHLWRPLRTHIDVSDVALELEGQFPQLDDRLATTINFLQTSPAGRDESPALRAAVIRQTLESVREMELRRALNPGPLVTIFVLGVVVSLAIGLLGYWRPAEASIGLTRLFNPLTDTQWPKRTRLVLGDKRTVVVPIGEDFQARVEADPAHVIPDRVTIHYREAGSDAFEAEVMDPLNLADAHAFGKVFTRVRQSFEYYIEGGDDSTRESGLIHVDARPRPRVEAVSMSIQPPPYIESGEVQTFEGQGTTRALQGSTVTMVVSTNKPIAAMTAGGPQRPNAFLRLGTRELPLEFVKPGSPIAEAAAGQVGPDKSLEKKKAENRLLQAKFEVEATVSFNFKLVCVDGFTGEPTEDYYLVAVEDEAPKVRLLLPTQAVLDVTPRSVVPVRVQARDDCGLNPDSVQIGWILTSAVKGKNEVKYLKLSVTDSEGGAAKSPLTVEAQRRWDLADGRTMPELNVGDEIVYTGEAADRFSWKGKTHEPSKTPEYRLHVVSTEAITEKLRRDLIAAAMRVDDLVKHQEDLQGETKNTRAEKQDAEALSQKGREQVTGQEGAQNQLKKEAQDLDQVFADLLEQFRLNRIPQDESFEGAKQVQQALKDVAADSMPKTSDALSETRKTEAKPPEQSKSLDKSIDEQQRTIDTLRSVLGKLEKFTEAEALAQNLKQILREQQSQTKKTSELATSTVGKSADELTAEEREAQQSGERRQSELSKNVNDAVEQMKETANKLEENEPAVAEAIREAVKEADNRKPSNKMKKAAQQISQNQAAVAGTNQKSAEEDLQAMIDKLGDRRMAELKDQLKTLAELKQELGEVKKAEQGHLGENRAQQKSDPKAASPKEQAPKQEKTAETTKNLADKMSKAEAPDASESTQNAGQKMSQAQGSLSQSQSQPAEKKQEQSLKDLDQADQQLDQAMQDKKDELEQKQLEKMQQKLARIRDGEVKVNETTTNIEVKRVDGKIAERSDKERLGFTQDQQKELLNESGDIVKEMKEAGVVVFTMYLARATDQMDLSHQLLVKTLTDLPTQTAQKKAIAMLDRLCKAIEDDLATKKKKKGGGGGGQGSGGGKKEPLVPTLAELKMLRALQDDVNEETVTVNKVIKEAKAPPSEVQDQTKQLGQEQKNLKKLMENLVDPQAGQSGGAQ